jgi:hypothetical protein
MLAAAQRPLFYLSSANETNHCTKSAWRGATVPDKRARGFMRHLGAQEKADVPWRKLGYDK